MSPDGKLLAVASRESAQTGIEGRTISFIDVERAAAGAVDSERARVMVGTSDATVATRPFAVAFTKDGKHVIVTCFRSNTVSLVASPSAVTTPTCSTSSRPLVFNRFGNWSKATSGPIDAGGGPPHSSRNN